VDEAIFLAANTAVLGPWLLLLLLLLLLLAPRAQMTRHIAHSPAPALVLVPLYVACIFFDPCGPQGGELLDLARSAMQPGSSSAPSRAAGSGSTKRRASPPLLHRSPPPLSRRRRGSMRLDREGRFAAPAAALSAAISSLPASVKEPD
jgi:hypothetical protein